MNRNTIGDRRPPTRVGAGVEIAVEVHSDNLTIGIGANRCTHHARVALRGREHGFRAGINDAAGLAGFQRDKPEQRLNGDIQF